jgi:polar amino acid transport system ATP-binding protein
VTGKLLVVDDIYKSFGTLSVLNGVSFDMKKRDKKVIIGPSGSGKSTLLRCINQLSPPDRGKIWLDGSEVTDPKIDVSKVRQQIGMVFQHFNLFTHLSALENITIGLTKVKGLKKKEAADKSMQELDRVGLTGKADSYPAQLSGGQQQRVSIARALAMEPQLMLFDEPTSALDPELIGEVLKVMEDIAREGMTMLVVTHEMGFARSICDEIIFMEEGKVLEKGPPQQFFNNPTHKRTQKFLGKINELYGGKE